MLRRLIPLAVFLGLTAGCQVAVPLPGTSTSAVPPGPLSEELAALPVAPEDTGAHYDRDDWLPQWARSGECTTRETVLRQQGQGVVVDGRCAPTAGSWYSTYDGVTVTNPRDLDIDHIVPLAEVARSGPIVDGRRQRPGSWPEDQRRAYANDIEGLVAVTSSSNRSKSDDDPARWLPDLDQCGYVTAWVRVKRKYNLSVDQTERDAITSVASRCG